MSSRGNRRLIAFVIMVVSACGCRQDFQEIADDHVRKDVLAGYEKIPALSFFEKQGRFFDMDESTHVDHEVVVPLLKRLLEIAPTPQWAVLRPKTPKVASAVLIGLPKDARTVDRMADAVQAADDNFSGFIVQQWGHEWLMIDLIDQQAYEVLKKSNPDIDKQR